jgi:hypothetical protein
MTTIAECSSVDEAMVLRSLLADSGISAFVPDELTVPFRGSIGPVRLQVEDEDAEAARSVLSEGGPA